MLNFNDLELVVNDTYSFVGIAKDGAAMRFHLPKGFSSQLKTLNTFEGKRDLFFLLYRVLRRFKNICIDKGYLDSPTQLAARDRDGIVRGKAGATLARNLDEALIFYSKLDSVGALLDVYDELKIVALAYRLGRVEQVEFTQLHRFLHQGVFLRNGAVYIDTMTLPRHQVQVKATDIVAMYSYLVMEVKAQLGDDASLEVAALSERFQQHYLDTEASLFNEADFERVLNDLKDALDVIDRHTPLKDEDYYQFYDAIETFLYGNWQRAKDGEIWGINNFHTVWESICLTYLAKTAHPSSLLWLDRRFVPNGVLQTSDATPKLLNLSTTFTCNGTRLVPDAVVFPSVQTAVVTPQRMYRLEKNNWDDYGYWTNCDCISARLNSNITIAYVNQPIRRHTLDELKSFYPHGRVIVDRPLPKQFYSYWSIDDENNYLTAQAMAMHDLNHIFYVAIRQGFLTFDAFREKFLSSLGLGGSKFSKNDNVFTQSLFRGYSLESIRERFEFWFFST